MLLKIHFDMNYSEVLLTLLMLETDSHKNTNILVNQEQIIIKAEKL